MTVYLPSFSQLSISSLDAKGDNRLARSRSALPSGSNLSAMRLMLLQAPQSLKKRMMFRTAQTRAIAETNSIIVNYLDYSSRYLLAALTMIEKPKRKNEPAMMASDSMGEQSLPNNDNTPPKRHIAPIMLMALGTMLWSLRDSFFSINSLYRSYPDLGFSSIFL